MKATQRPVVVGLLGGIASGKSSVAAILGELGAAVLDADQIARKVLERADVRQALVARFGPSVAPPSLTPVGGVDRAALAKATFGNPEALSYLESLVHPRVGEELANRFDELVRRADLPAIVLDIPLLIESSPLIDRCDLLLHVESPPQERRRRGMESRGWGVDELARREAHQLSTEEKRRRADVIVKNDGSLAQLRDAVTSWLGGAGGFAGLPRRPAHPRRSDQLDERNDRSSERR